MTIDILLAGNAGDFGDNATEERVAEIAVFVSEAGQIGKGKAAADEFEEIAVFIFELPIAPGIVFGKTGGVREQIANGDLGRVFGERRDALEFREMFFGGIVEVKFALIAQVKNGRRGKTFGHGGDAEERLRSGGGCGVGLGKAVSIGE